MEQKRNVKKEYKKLLDEHNCMGSNRVKYCYNNTGEINTLIAHKKYFTSWVHQYYFLCILDFVDFNKNLEIQLCSLSGDLYLCSRIDIIFVFDVLSCNSLRIENLDLQGKLSL